MSSIKLLSNGTVVNGDEVIGNWYSDSGIYEGEYIPTLEAEVCAGRDQLIAWFGKKIAGDVDEEAAYVALNASLLEDNSY